MLTDPPEPDHSRDRRPLRAGRRRAPRSAATGTTRSCSPTAPRCSRSATSSATTPAPRRRWARCAGLLRGIGYSSGGSPAEVLTELDRADRGPGAGHHGHRAGRPARAGRRRPARRPGAAALVQRRPPAAGRADPPTARSTLLDEEPPTCCWAWPRRPSGAEHVTVLDARRHRAALHRRAGRAARPRPRRRHRRAASRCCGELRRPAAGRAVRPGARAAVPARRRGRRRAARRAAAPAGPAAPGRGRSAAGAGEHRAGARRDPRGRLARPDAQGRRRARRLPSRLRARSGRSTATGASQPRHTDSTRSPATSTITTAATGSGASPSGPASTVSAAAPISAATALYGPGLDDVGPLGEQHVADHRAADRGAAVPMNTTEALGSPASCAFCAPMTVKKPERDGVQDDQQPGEPGQPAGEVERDRGGDRHRRQVGRVGQRDRRAVGRAARRGSARRRARR